MKLKDLGLAIDQDGQAVTRKPDVQTTTRITEAIDAHHGAGDILDDRQGSLAEAAVGFEIQTDKLASMPWLKAQIARPMIPLESTRWSGEPYLMAQRATDLYFETRDFASRRRGQLLLWTFCGTRRSGTDLFGTILERRSLAMTS